MTKEGSHWFLFMYISWIKFNTHIIEHQRPSLRGLRQEGAPNLGFSSGYIGFKLCHDLTRIKRNGFLFHCFNDFHNSFIAFVTTRFSTITYFNRLLIHVPTSCGHSINMLWSGWWKVKWSSSSIVHWSKFTKISTHLIIVIVILVFLFFLFLLMF